MDKLLNPEVKDKFHKEIIKKLEKIDISNQSTNVSYNESRNYDECNIYNVRESEIDKTGMDNRRATRFMREEG